jgi:3-oxoacyl-[acyl-carrier-protein] synthase III
LYKAGLTVADLDWLILHQANQRIMDAVADRIGLPTSKIVSNVAEYGNTSAASIPIALNAAVRSGQIKAGDTIATSGFGAGLSWGAAILNWGHPARS